jgi:predicted molibdopterin-dependent oxidoreductase YjgC
MRNLRTKNIRRTPKVQIKVNGHEIDAYRGETVLAALVASGYKKLKKSHVTGELRGPLCGMGVCYECQVMIDGIPNLRSCMIEVEDKMEIRTGE